MRIKKLFSEQLKVVNIGSPVFKVDFDKQNLTYVDLDWTPPAHGNTKLLDLLNELVPYADQIKMANQQVVDSIKGAEGRLIAVKKALDVIPNMTKHTILHAGPPISFEQMAGPMKGAIIGALIYEDLARNEKEALALIQSGKIIFDSAHHHDAVGPMAGIISASMPVHVLYNIVHKNYAYCTINEGLGKVLRYGANSTEVLDRLRFMEKTMMPILNEALTINGGIDIKSIIVQSLHMGDECHNRNKASSAIFLREIAADIFKTSAPFEDQVKVLDFIRKNEHYFLNLSMPFCKLAMDTTKHIKNSTIVRAMSRNGVDFGILLAGGDTWYT